MKTFLLKNKKPFIKWGYLPDNTSFKGKLPKGYNLGVCPSKGFVVVDVDRHGDIDGFANIPEILKVEFSNTFHYKTKNNGAHYWFRYSGNNKLANKSSSIGIDLRTHKGYVVWYPSSILTEDPDGVNKSSALLNVWLESLFGFLEHQKTIICPDGFKWNVITQENAKLCFRAGFEVYEVESDFTDHLIETEEELKDAINSNIDLCVNFNTIY